MKKSTAVIMLATLLCLASCGGTPDFKDETTVDNDLYGETSKAPDTTDETTEAEETTEAPETEEAVETDKIVETLENDDNVITIVNKKTGESILVTVLSADNVYKTEYHFEHVYGMNLVVKELTYLRKSEFIENEYLAHEILYEYNEKHQTTGLVVRSYLSGGTVYTDSKVTLHENGEYKTMETVYAFPDKNVKREVEEFDENGNLVKTTKYDENGNVIE